MRLLSFVRSYNILRLGKQKGWVSPQVRAQASISEKDLVSERILSIVAIRSRALVLERSEVSKTLLSEI